MTYFEVASVEKTEEWYWIRLQEKELDHGEFLGHKLISKGCYEEITIKDFPIRGKACFLKVKLRRWLDESLSEIASRDWDLVAKGTRMPKEFAAFLKAGIDTTPVSCKSLGNYFHVNGKLLVEQYAVHLSDYPTNVGESLNIDETSLSRGALYHYYQQALKGKKEY